MHLSLGVNKRVVHTLSGRLSRIQYRKRYQSERSGRLSNEEQSMWCCKWSCRVWARALGNRSLLGDVRYDIKDTVNKIKQRELFRPFAPAILEEYADEYFDGHKNEYMQYQSVAKHDYKSVIHVDGTSRCQVVKKDCQSVIRPILEEYFERTGIPMLLNTSLNIKGQPILNDERDVEEWEKKYKVRIF